MNTNNLVKDLSLLVIIHHRSIRPILWWILDIKKFMHFVGFKLSLMLPFMKLAYIWWLHLNDNMSPTNPTNIVNHSHSLETLLRWYLVPITTNSIICEYHVYRSIKILHIPVSHIIKIINSCNKIRWFVLHLNP